MLESVGNGHVSLLLILILPVRLLKKCVDYYLILSVDDHDEHQYSTKRTFKLDPNITGSSELSSHNNINNRERKKVLLTLAHSRGTTKGIG